MLITSYVRCLFVAVLAFSVLPVVAEDVAAIRQVSESGIKHSFLVTGSNDHVYYFGEDNEIIWQTPGGSRDGYVLENGNVIVTSAAWAREYKAGTQEVVWEYKLSEQNAEMSTTVKLGNGHYMITELGEHPRILEVDGEGVVKVEVPLQPETDNHHMQTRMARKLPNGNYLVPHLFAFAVKEYTPEGKVVRTIRTDLPEFGGRDVHNWPFTAILLENGNIHVNMTHGNKVGEFAPDGRVVWWVDNTQVEGEPFQDPCGAQRLTNGNAVIGAYAQRDASKARIFEITQDKKIVWEFFHPALHAHEIHIVTTNGEKITNPMR
jgi:hypothetical protein